MEQQHSAALLHTQSKAELHLVPLQATAQLWPKAATYINRSLRHADGMITLDDMEEAVVSGRYQLWLIVKGYKVLGAGVTEMMKNGTCFVWAFGGKKMHEWFPLHEELEAWAKRAGCNAIHFFGRLGWDRVLRSEGYEKRMVIMRKEL